MAAKAKFVRENKRLRGFWMVYRSVAMQCNWFGVTKQRICAESTRRNWRIWISGKIETRVGVAETRRVWSEDVPIVMEYKRRLGLIAKL
jgi:hypothetical protein